VQLQLTYLYISCSYMYIYTFLNPANSILLVLKSAKCLRREEKTHTNRTSVYVIHETSLRRWCVAKRSVKKKFLNTWYKCANGYRIMRSLYICDTSVCAPCYYPFRYGGSENANTRVSVYLYCVIIVRLFSRRRQRR